MLNPRQCIDPGHWKTCFFVASSVENDGAQLIGFDAPIGTSGGGEGHAGFFTGRPVLEATGY